MNYFILLVSSRVSDPDSHGSALIFLSAAHILVFANRSEIGVLYRFKESLEKKFKIFHQTIL
jgi:hypothetical protein